MENAEKEITALRLVMYLAMGLGLGLCCTASAVCALSGALFSA